MSTPVGVFLRRAREAMRGIMATWWQYEGAQSGQRPSDTHYQTVAQDHGTPSTEQVSRSRAMRPTIDRTTFGSITIDGQRVEHDVVIRLSGRVKKRKKRLSKAVYGTSHVLSLAEAKHVYDKGTTRLIIGTGQQG